MSLEQVNNASSAAVATPVEATLPAKTAQTNLSSRVGDAARTAFASLQNVLSQIRNFFSSLASRVIEFFRRSEETAGEPEEGSIEHVGTASPVQALASTPDEVVEEEVAPVQTEEKKGPSYAKVAAGVAGAAFVAAILGHIAYKGFAGAKQDYLDAYSKVAGYASDAYSYVGTKASEAGSAVSSAASSTATYVADTASSAKNAVSGAASSTATYIADTASSVKNSTLATYAQVVDTVKSYTPTFPTFFGNGTASVVNATESV